MDATTRVSCIHADRCPGCALIDRPYGEQLDAKRGLVERAFRRHAALAPVEVEPIRGADPITGYRVRAKLAVGAGTRIGAYLPGTHEVLDIPGCQVLAPAIARAVAEIRRRLAEAPLQALSAVDLRSAETDTGTQVLVTLIVERRAHEGAALERLAADLMKACSDVAGVLVSESDASSPMLLGGPPAAIAGETSLPDRTAGAELVATAGTFVQAHRAQADRIVEDVAHAFGALDGARVLDLYGGSGAIGLALAARGAHVTIVESHAASADAARRAGERFGARVEVVREDAARFLANASPGRFELAVVNPPRRGVPPEARAALGSLGLTTLVYVSCHPETLARDLAHLSLLGLGAQSARPVDMIPLTAQVETVAVLGPRDPPPPVVLLDEAGLVAVEKAPHEPTTPQGEHALSLLARVRRLPGCADVVPLHRLDAITSGVCLFAKSRSVAGPWSASLSAGKKRYLALARGITSEKGSVKRALVIDGKARPARTRYRRLATVNGHSLLTVLPDDGRKHQIRRHLAGLGHPIVGDARHGHAPTNRHFAERYGLDRAFLHCGRVELCGPDGVERVIESPLAADLTAVLDIAREAGNVGGAQEIPDTIGLSVRI